MFARRYLLFLGLSTLAAGSVPAAEQDPIRIAPRQLKATAHGVGQLIPDVTGKDITGKVVRVSDYRKRKALVVALTSTSCPLSKLYAVTLAKLEKTYRKKGVAFLFVDPIGTDTVKEVQAAIRTHGLQGAYIHDKDEQWVRALRAATTTEVFVLDAARTLIYRGAVDDQYGLGYSQDAPRHTYLADALDAFLAGKTPEVQATTAPGCDLEYSEKKGKATAITYHNRISRIVQNNCLECHRKGGIAPFSLETYKDVVAHRGMIRQVVERGVMPPWFASAEKGKPTVWANDRALPDADKADLLAWLKSDRPLGDPKNAPLPRKFPTDWQLGKPDMIVQIPNPIEVKATGRMPYKHARVQTTLKEDRWVQAVEIRPTERAVVHHVLVFVIDRGGKRINERSGFFAAYVPGNTAQRYPTGFAKKLPAGATLVFQLHYTPNGKATTDQTQLGIHFSEKPPRHIIRNVGIANHRFRIPPHADNHAVKAQLTVPADVKLLSFMPHMHLRGKAFRYEVVLPGNKRQRILDVPHYDFNWQLEYRLAQPLDVPRGSKLELTGWYDNSKNNPANPDPSKTVRWGPQTEDEMMLGYVEYYVPSETPTASTGNGNKPSTRPLGKSRAEKALERAFQRYDRNGDGKVTAKELGRPGLFRRLDTNKDGHVTLEEARTVLKRLAR